ncbi:iron-siderophore ABC transporter substrate-binding protein [Aeromicrobium duanguangcaii]|uniref:Iron-siderophore ABC transporter substrate-binding protein n=1 Tax=Aeromicrobium duanguangcaii TaxID=2968086 RepID=A0ABY5KCM5_9ACTN|nr:iron-siderophore ABC transporter substrate-binding protein [Aeromicrobium duanguangcaii]UUI68224.1 iron-siderophore ABC transporter substrate-binding protein [Aeromicrobium duanguangcaii]
MLFTKGTPLRLAPLLTAATLALSLAACGSSSDDSNEASGASGENFPVTIEHALGKTEITSEPKRVATVAWSNQDTALALGVVPVGMPKATYGDDDTDGLHPWVKDKIDELDGETPVLFDETDGIDAAAVAQTSPDLILAPNSGLTKEEYETLSKIAPTVAYPDEAWGTTWRDAIKLTGQALGKSDQATTLIADLEQQMADAVAKHPEIKGKSAVMSWIDPTDLSKVGYYTAFDTRAAFLNDLGFSTPDFVTKASQTSDQFFLEVSAEKADELGGADVFVGYGDAAALKKAQADSLVGKIPAIERGSVALLKDNTPLAAAVSPSALSIPWMLDDYVALLADAAAKVK